MESQLNLLTIPLDLHIEILSFVPPWQVVMYSRCCKHFKSVTEDDRVWTSKDPIQISTKNGPTARVCVAAVIHKDSLFIYGGDASRDEKIDNVRNDLWSFNFHGGKWQEYPSQNALRPLLTEHSGVLHNDKMYLFGGNCGNAVANSHFVLGNAVHVIGLDDPVKAVKDIKADSARVARRSAHTAVVYKDKMYIYGGWDGKVSFGDFHQFDFKTQKWETVVSAGGESPGKRRAHCAVVHDHYMYIFGGFDTAPASKYCQMHRFDFETKTWETFFGTGELPRGRSRADMVVYQDKIYILGGWDRREYFSDLCEFNIQTHAWRIYKTGLKPLVKGIGQHKCVMYKNWLVVVCGFSAKDNMSTNKLFAINLQKKNTK